MTEQEKTEIIEELEARFCEKYKGILSREDVATTLSEPRNKWFKDPDIRSASIAKESPMVEALGNCFVAWQVWDEIRKLTCRICGKSYVRQLTATDKADEVAEEICALVHKLAMDRRQTQE